MEEFIRDTGIGNLEPVSKANLITSFGVGQINTPNSPKPNEGVFVMTRNSTQAQRFWFRQTRNLEMNPHRKDDESEDGSETHR